MQMWYFNFFPDNFNFLKWLAAKNHYSQSVIFPHNFHFSGKIREKIGKLCFQKFNFYWGGYSNFKVGWFLLRGDHNFHIYIFPVSYFIVSFIFANSAEYVFSFHKTLLSSCFTIFSTEIGFWMKRKGHFHKEISSLMVWSFQYCLFWLWWNF